MLELLILLVVPIAVALVFCVVLIRVRPGWARWRAVLLAALPVPTLLLGFCVFVFTDAATTPQQHCGTDACGMAMVAAMFIGAAALGALLLSLTAAALLAWWLPR